MVSLFLLRLVEMVKLENAIHEKTKFAIDQQQRDYYLREQMRAIRDELGEAEEKEPVFDDDSPMMMREQLMQFKRINHQNRTKPTISLRISPATLKKAKQYGKGYTGLLSRLLDAAIDDEDLVRKCI